jgi:hypothetical protein
MGIPFVLAAFLLAAPPHARAAALDTAMIEQLTGAKGRTNGVGSVKLTPPSGLTSWAAFTPAGADVMVMGDLVLTEDQVNPVMSVALEAGLEVTALHNHFLGESPRVMFMHIGGMGSVDALAGAVGKVFAGMRAAGAPIPTADVDPARSQLDGDAIASALGHKGDMAGGVYKVTIGRTTGMHGHTVGATMGVNTWAAFSGTNEQAVVDGDFAMLETELQPVLKALRHADIQVVAIHQHMSGESPRIVFLHYWGVGPAAALARGLRAALDQTKP